MLKQRVLTAIVGLLALIGVFTWGSPLVIQGLYVIMVALSCREIASIVIHRLETAFAPNWSGKDDPVSARFSIWVAIFLGVVAFTASSSSSAAGALGVVIAAMTASMVIGSFSSRHVPTAMARVLGFLVTICYGALPWIALWNLYFMIPGGHALFFLLTVVWAGDTGAYFGGLTFGRRKLAVWLSPKKTIEGALSGLLASIIGGLVYVHFFAHGFAGLDTWETVLICFIAGVFGQIGDLIESLWKRFSMVKDSGSLLPGHGGFLDRVDGLLFAGPLTWFILQILGS